MDEDADVMPHIAQTDEGLVRHDRAPANRPRVPSLAVALTAETTVADHGAIGLDHGGRRSAGNGGEYRGNSGRRQAD